MLFIDYDDYHGTVDASDINSEVEDAPIVSSTEEIALPVLSNIANNKPDQVNLNQGRATKMLNVGLEGAVILGGILQIPPTIIKFFAVTMRAAEVVGHILTIPAEITKGISIFQPLVNAFRWHPIVNAVAAGLEGCGIIATSLNHKHTTNFREKVETGAQQAYFEELKRILTDPNEIAIRAIITDKERLSKLMDKVTKALNALQSANDKVITEFEEEIGLIEPGILARLKAAGDAAHDIAYIASIKQMKASLIKENFSVNGLHLKAALERISNASPSKNAKIVKNLKMCVSDKIASDRLSILSGIVSGVASIVFLAIMMTNPLGYVLSGVAIMIIIGKAYTEVQDRQNFEKAMGMPVTSALECIFHFKEYWEEGKKLIENFLDFCRT